MPAATWLRKNLFNGWWNSLLTVVTVAGLILLLRPLLAWTFTEARWFVIPATARLLAVGPFPVDQVWRVWTLLGATLFLVTLTVWLRRSVRPWVRPSIVTLWVMLPVLTVALLSAVPINLWGGLMITLIMTVAALAIAFPLGILLALGRVSSMPVIRILSTTFVELMRGVPLVSVLFLAWLMVPLFVPENWRTPQLVRAIIGFALFNGAYISEYVRGGLQGVPKGQGEAARALGLGGFDTMYRIVLPQALRSVVPGLVGQSITAFKNTSLVVIIGLLDLLGITQSILGNPRFLGLERELYAFLMLLFFCLASLMSWAGRRIELRMGLGTR